MEKVVIFGAGMSGMIAAINLARQGVEVEIHERESVYGGSSIYNPSTHTTPIDLDRTSEYIGIDISSVFHPLLDCPWYFHDTELHVPVKGVYTVERGNRKGSLDTLLFNECKKLGVNFFFNSPLRKEDIPQLPPGTIVACGLSPSAYEMLGIPYLRWYGWISRGEIGFNNLSWIWLDECVTEYGYLSSANNFYFNLLFSIRQVSEEALNKYKDFMIRHQGVEHKEWQYVSGAVPLASPDNPRLFQGNLILCGTISGAMDPMMWFGILGAITTGKIAAMAVHDPQGAQQEFHRFTRAFRAAYFIKNKIHYRIRPHVKLLEKILNIIGPSNFEKFNRFFDRHDWKGSIPGYTRVFGCY